jgi:hypothetical protein
MKEEHMADDDDDDHVNDPALVAKLSNVLLSPECQRINFRWGRQHMTGKAYRAVVLALSDSRISLFEADGAAHKLDDDVEASYIGKSETMIIHPRRNFHKVSNRQTIVHEATHAVQDAQLSGVWVWSLDEEATAYIAEWLYVIYCSPSANRLVNNPDPNDRIDLVALEIARSLAGRHGAVPDAAAMQRLGNAIYADPTYSVDMLLHPWTREDGVTAPDFP